jgi:hypothetical protein
MISTANNEKTNDVRLVEKTLTGDESAFDALVQKCSAPISLDTSS